MKRQPDGGVLADLTAHSPAPEGGSERAFGFVFAAVFSIVAFWPMWIGGAPRLWAAGIAGSFALAAAFAPRILKIPNRLWTRFGLLLGMIVSPIVLFVVYVIAVVPTGLLMRLAGKDALRRRFEAGAASYWVHRVPPARPDETMTRQF